VVECDGHDFADIERAIAEAVADPRPSLIACRTIIGKGAPNKQGGHNVHGSPLGDAEIAAARAVLGWTLPPSNCLPRFWPTGARGAGQAAPAMGRRLAAERKGAELPAAWRRTALAGGGRGHLRHLAGRRRRSPPARRANWLWKC
jgi:transketolase